jgi:hypothetical protein
MYMERIEAPVGTAKPPRSKALKLTVGILFLVFSAAVIAPWLCLVGLWFAVAAGLRGLVKLGGTIRDTAFYAGELVVGR